MSLPICAGCGCLGVSLGDERFCASCLRTINAQFDVGLSLLYEFMEKYAAYEVWCLSHGVAA